MAIVTTMTMGVRKVLLCSAIHLPTQQPADQKKEDDQEHLEQLVDTLRIRTLDVG